MPTLPPHDSLKHSIKNANVTLAMPPHHTTTIYEVSIASPAAAPAAAALLRSAIFSANKLAFQL